MLGVLATVASALWVPVVLLVAVWRVWIKPPRDITTADKLLARTLRRV